MQNNLTTFNPYLNSNGQLWGQNGILARAHGGTRMHFYYLNENKSLSGLPLSPVLISQTPNLLV